MRARAQGAGCSVRAVLGDSRAWQAGRDACAYASPRGPVRPGVRAVSERALTTASAAQVGGPKKTDSDAGLDENGYYTLVLVRHGESQWNKENRFTGWVDVPLAEVSISRICRWFRPTGVCIYYVYMYVRVVHDMSVCVCVYVHAYACGCYGVDR